MGFLAPPDPAAFTLRLALRVDETCADSRTSCGWVLLSTDDHPYRPSSGGSAGVNGYLFLLRADGSLDIERVVEGIATTLASSPGATALTLGSYVPLRITVTGSGLLFARVGDVDGTVTVADASHRPVPVVHLGGAFAGARFKDVVLT
jgi:glycerophosphoryl diester phosphodiesterase